MESENNIKEPENKPVKKKKKRSLFGFLQGKILTEDFIVKQSKLLLLIFGLILLFISNRYYCSKKLTEMDKLQKELIYLGNIQEPLTSRLTELSWQLKIEETLKEKGIELIKADTTIFQIRK